MPKTSLNMDRFSQVLLVAVSAGALTAAASAARAGTWRTPQTFGPTTPTPGGSVATNAQGTVSAVWTQVVNCAGNPNCLPGAPDFYVSRLQPSGAWASSPRAGTSVRQAGQVVIDDADHVGLVSNEYVGGPRTILNTQAASGAPWKSAVVDTSGLIDVMAFATDAADHATLLLRAGLHSLLQRPPGGIRKVEVDIANTVARSAQFLPNRGSYRYPVASFAVAADGRAVIGWSNEDLGYGSYAMVRPSSSAPWEKPIPLVKQPTYSFDTIGGAPVQAGGKAAVAFGATLNADQSYLGFIDI